MTYPQISDPAIIDVSTIHQIVQAINQHSDTLSALTNNFGSGAAIRTTSGDDWASTFDSGSQIIQFGRSKVTVNSSGTITDGKIVTFATPFSSTPVITATSTSSTTGNFDVNVSVSAASNSQFTMRADGANANTTFSINWIAIGSK